MTETWGIAELAAEYGVTTRTIRFSETSHRNHFGNLPADFDFDAWAESCFGVVTEPATKVRIRFYDSDSFLEGIVTSVSNGPIST